jgi:hypothetical protein
MATKLRKLRITRVDRVWAPANGDQDGPLARIVLAKAKTRAAMDHSDHEDMAAGDTCPECGYTHPNKSATPGGNMPTEQEQLAELRKAIDEAVAAAVDPVKAELATVQETYAGEKATFDAAVAATVDPDAIDKAKLPDAVRKRLEDAEAVAKAAEARVAKIEDAAEAARWLEVAKGLPFVAVAKAVGGNAAEETGALLHGIAKAAGEESATRLLGVLEAAQAKLAQSELLKSAGKDGSGAAFGAAGAQLEKAAADIRKGDPSITAAQAYAQAVDGNPDLALKATKEVWSPNA